MIKILLDCITWLYNHKWEVTLMLFIICAVFGFIGVNSPLAECSEITGYKPGG